MAKFKPQFKRLLFIDSCISRGTYPNCSSLAVEYEVSSRTIARDIEYMKDMLDAPLEYDGSRKGYYYTEPNYHLPAIDLRESDFFAICIAEKALSLYENTPMYEKLSSVFEKLKSLLPDDITVNTTWVDTPYTFMKESYTEINQEVWETISRSFRNMEQVRITHLKAGAPEASARIVSPYRLVNYRGEWYLVGYCSKRKTVLRFAMSRIKKAASINVKYEIPENFDIEKFLGPHFGIMTEEKEQVIKIKFGNEDAPYIKERLWHPEQQIKENRDGSIILSFPTNSLLEVRRWVLSWGGGAQVLGPGKLVRQVKDDIEKMGRLY